MYLVPFSGWKTLKLSSKAEERQALGVYQGAGDGEGGYTMTKQSEKVDERQALVGGGRRRCAAQQRGVRDADGALRVDPGFCKATSVGVTSASFQS